MQTGVKKRTDIRFNRILYTGFVLIAIWSYFFSKDTGTALANLGIALAFDPFSPEVPWPQRPLYQRIWLGVHIILVFALLFLTIF